MTVGSGPYVLLLALCGCEAELASGLDEAQASEIVLALDEAGIGASKERGAADETFRVVVQREDVAPALSVMREQELPRENAPGFDALFSERGLVPSASEERARHAAAMAGELARSIETIDGVVHARVHLAMPETSTRLLDEAPAPASASVLIEHERGARFDDDDVRALVAGAVPELSIERVAVVRTAVRARRHREARLVTLGPITVTRGTAGTLKALLAISFALNLLFAALVIARRRRRPEREPAARDAHSS